MIKVSESEKRTIECPECGARPGKRCRGSRIPGPNTFGGGWGGPPDLERAHKARRDAAIALRPVGNGSEVVKLAWGMQPPPEASVAWGARAIYSRRTDERGRPYVDIALLWDRQDIQGRDGAARKALAAFVNETAIPTVKRLCMERHIAPSSDEVIEFGERGFHVKASPRASHGYLYIAVWAAVAQ